MTKPNPILMDETFDLTPELLAAVLKDFQGKLDQVYVACLPKTNNPIFEIWSRSFPRLNSAVCSTPPRPTAWPPSATRPSSCGR